MKKFTKLKLLIAFALTIAFSVNSWAQLSCYNTVGYFPSWSGAASAIDYSKYTHINYSFGIPNSNGTIGAIENSAKLVDLVNRGHASNTKVLLAIGGWLSSSPSGTPFESIATNSTAINQFVNSCANLINQYNLDGIDIDWEYPTSQARWNALIVPLANRIHSMGKLLTAAVPAGSYYGNGVGNLAVLDLVNIMAYDCNCPTNSPYSQAVDALNYWTGRGVPQNKRMLGVPFYSSDNNTSLHVQKANLAKSNAGGIMIWEISTYGDINAIVNTLGNICKGGTPPPPTCTVYNTNSTIQAESYCTMSGIQTENTTDAGGGQNVGWIEAGDWMSYKVNVPSSGSYTVQYRVASESGGGSIRLERLGGSAVFGTVGVPSTGGWQNWQTVSHTVQLTAGQQDIAVAAAAGGFNINWISINSNGTPPPTGAPIGQTIWLRGSLNNLYVSSENGTGPMWCNRTSAQAWENFTVVDAGNGKIALRSMSKYVSSENGTAAITCNRTAIGGWEAFDWITNADGTISLRGNNGRYVSSENGTAAMTCTKTSIGGWEAFRFGTAGSARTGAPETAETAGFYPNPATNQLTYSLPEGVENHTLQVKDFSGKSILKKSFGNTGKENTIDVSTWKSGLYIINISDKSFSKTFKIQKQ
ncbi:MAG TPA: glycosyl hydrolase family 18 protein [Cytophagales bacterium]|nr:glycosyl hydrolase family 18 protein [Cytophagales bacterium]